MHILVTGGAGFIGSHLSEHLLASGHHVVVIDDLSTGSIRNLEAIKSHPRFEYYIDTIFNPRLMAELVDSADLIFHLAAAVGVKRIVEFPVQTIETNVKGSEVILDLAAKKLKRLIIASTSEVYGKSNKIPFSENDDLVLGSTYNARWSYACSKAIDEFLALAYFREKGLPVTVVRLFNTVGPRQTGQYGMVLPTFVNQALRGEPITVFGTGDQSRCFVHVQDVIEGLMACAKSEHAAGEIFNLGNTEEITMNGLANRVLEAVGSASEIVHVPYSQAYAPGFEDMERRVPDIRKAQKCFAYAPKRSLDDIIESVVSYFATKGDEERSGVRSPLAVVPKERRIV